MFAVFYSLKISHWIQLREDHTRPQKLPFHTHQGNKCKSQRETLKEFWGTKLRFKVNCKNKDRPLREKLTREDIPRCFGGFVSLNDNKRLSSGGFDECCISLSSFYNMKIVIMTIPILQMRKLWLREAKCQMLTCIVSSRERIQTQTPQVEQASLKNNKLLKRAVLCLQKREQKVPHLPPLLLTSCISSVPLLQLINQY